MWYCRVDRLGLESDGKWFENCVFRAALDMAMLAEVERTKTTELASRITDFMLAEYRQRYEPAALSAPTEVRDGAEGRSGEAPGGHRRSGLSQPGY